MKRGNNTKYEQGHRVSLSWVKISWYYDYKVQFRISLDPESESDFVIICCIHCHSIYYIMGTIMYPPSLWAVFLCRWKTWPALFWLVKRNTVLMKLALSRVYDCTFSVEVLSYLSTWICPGINHATLFIYLHSKLWNLVNMLNASPLSEYCLIFHHIFRELFKI